MILRRKGLATKPTLLGLNGVLLEYQQIAQLRMRCYGCTFVWLTIIKLSPLRSRRLIIEVWHFGGFEVCCKNISGFDQDIPLPSEFCAV